MSIKVFKRTREEVTPATVPVTYTEWSEWIETTDAPPYTNTLLMEYRTTNEAEIIYKRMEILSKGTIESYVNSRSINSEQTTEIIASTINTMLVSSFDFSLRKEMLAKDLLLKDEQIETEKKRVLDIASQTSVRDAQSAKDLLLKDEQIETEKKNQLIKDQQELSEKIKNGGIHYNYTYYVDGDAEVITGSKKTGDVKTKTIAIGNTKSIYELDKEAKTAQISYTNAQEEALGEQLEDNRKIKVMNNISSTYGTMGAGGLTVSSDAWKFYFQIAESLIGNNSGISIPTSNTIVKVG